MFFPLVSANLIQNGDFEWYAAQYCGNDWCALSHVTQMNAIYPWVASTTFELDRSVWGQASGQWSMDLNSDQPYSIHQAVSLQNGATYSVSYSIYGNYFCEGNQKVGGAYINNALLQTFYHSNGQGWLSYTFTFTAPSDIVYVRFSTHQGGGCGPVLDNVQMNLIQPPPQNLLPPPHSNLIQNGDFELYSAQYCGSDWCALSHVTQMNAIYPWVASTTFELDRSVWGHASGHWSMDLNSDQPYSIHQAVSLQKGATYSVSYSIYGNYFCEGNQKVGGSYINNVLQQTFYHSNGQGWLSYSYTFTAPSDQVTVRFSTHQGGGCGPVLDNVQMYLVQPAPKPPTSNLLGGTKRKSKPKKKTN